MEGIINVENTWDNTTSDALLVEGLVIPISSAITMTKSGKASGLKSQF